MNKFLSLLILLLTFNSCTKDKPNFKGTWKTKVHKSDSLSFLSELLDPELIFLNDSCFYLRLIGAENSGEYRFDPKNGSMHMLWDVKYIGGKYNPTPPQSITLEFDKGNFVFHKVDSTFTERAIAYQNKKGESLEQDSIEHYINGSWNWSQLSEGGDKAMMDFLHKHPIAFHLNTKHNYYLIEYQNKKDDILGSMSITKDGFKLNKNLFDFGIMSMSENKLILLNKLNKGVYTFIKNETPLSDYSRYTGSAREAQVNTETKNKQPSLSEDDLNNVAEFLDYYNKKTTRGRSGNEDIIAKAKPVSPGKPGYEFWQDYAIQRHYILEDYEGYLDRIKQSPFPEKAKTSLIRDFQFMAKYETVEDFIENNGMYDESLVEDYINGIIMFANRFKK